MFKSALWSIPNELELYGPYELCNSTLTISPWLATTSSGQRSSLKIIPRCVWKFYPRKLPKNIQTQIYYLEFHPWKLPEFNTKVYCMQLPNILLLYSYSKRICIKNARTKLLFPHAWWSNDAFVGGLLDGAHYSHRQLAQINLLKGNAILPNKSKISRVCYQYRHCTLTWSIFLWLV
jgi:hypothetical protein